MEKKFFKKLFYVSTVVFSLLALFSQKTYADFAYVSQFGTFGTGNGEFDSVEGLAIDSLGYIYVADSGNNRIEKFDKNDTYVAQFGSTGTGSGQLDFPYNVAIDKSDNIYVVDCGNNRVEKFDSNGNYLSQFGSAGSGDGQFNNVLSLALDSLGKIYVVDAGNHRVEKFDSSGNYISQFGGLGSSNGQLHFPDGIFIDNSDNIYVIDSGNSRVEKFDSNGNYLSQFGSAGSGDGQFNGMGGLAINSTGYIYVVDGNNRVEKFDSNGNYLSQFGSAGSGDGQFNGAEFIAIDNSGSIYIGDDSNNRVQKLSDVSVPPTSTPTPIPANQNNSSSSTTSNSSTSVPTCTNQAPTSTPDLFQIDTSGTKATLYFAPAGMPYDNYVIRFGPTENNLLYSAFFSRGFAPGVIYYTVNDLNPNTTYYFQVRAGNGCMPGNWGNTLSAKTTGSINSTSKSYESLGGFIKSLLSSFSPKYTGPAINNSIPTPTTVNNTPGQCTQYTVLRGDSFWTIAQKLLGSGQRYLEIWKANTNNYPTLKNSSVIRAGWKLSVGC